MIAPCGYTHWLLTDSLCTYMHQFGRREDFCSRNTVGIHASCDPAEHFDLAFTPSLLAYSSGLLLRTLPPRHSGLRMQSAPRRLMQERGIWNRVGSCRQYGIEDGAMGRREEGGEAITTTAPPPPPPRTDDRGRSPSSTSRLILVEQIWLDGTLAVSH